MKGLVSWAQGIVLAFGGPGLLLISVLDSSFLSFPELVDVLVVWLTLRNPALLVYYAGIGALGSLLGSLVLYWMGRKGGEAFMRRRFHDRHVDRGLETFQRWGVLALFVPSLLPPPTPFKLFVLSAGVAGVSTVRFVLAVSLGRFVRYGGEALLAVWFGEQVVLYIMDHGLEAGIILSLVVAAGVALYVFRARRRARGESGV